MSLRQKLFFCWSLSWLSCFKHTPSSQRVFSRQALKQVPTAGFPSRKSMYLQLEILYFDTSMMDSMNLKADKLFFQESRFNENTRKQNVKETCWDNTTISPHLKHYEWAHHYPRALRICLVWVESTTSSWMFLKRYMTLKSFQAWKIHGFPVDSGFKFFFLVLEVGDLNDVALLIFLGFKKWISRSSR